MAISPQVVSVTLPLSADGNSASIDCLLYTNVSLQHTWTSGSGTGGSAQAQASNDGVTWTSYGSAVTISTASGSSTQDSTNAQFNFRFLRVAYTHGSVSAGTYVAYICLKKNP